MSAALPPKKRKENRRSEEVSFLLDLKFDLSNIEYHIHIKFNNHFLSLQEEETTPEAEGELIELRNYKNIFQRCII